jgi:hypothetical protein
MAWVAEKFVAHHAGSRRPESVWRRLWEDWVEGERTVPVPSQQRSQPGNWWESLRATREHGEQLGVKFEAGDTAALMTARVFVAAGDGPWRRKVDPLVARFMEEIYRRSEAAA